MNNLYILKDKIPVATDNLVVWAKFNDDINNRRVNKTDIEGINVSTVFLGIDHGYNTKKPVLFETMAFVDDTEWMERCCTWEQAEIMHQKMCDRVRNHLYSAALDVSDILDSLSK